MKTITVDQFREDIEDMIMSELLEDAIGFSRLYKSPAEEFGENWSAKGYSLVDGMPIEQFDGDLAQELSFGHVTTHREITIRGANWQVDLCASDTIGADGETKGAGTVDLNISPSNDPWVLGEIHEVLEGMIENP